MYYLVNALITAWQHISPEVLIKGAVYPMQWMGPMMVVVERQ